MKSDEYIAGVDYSLTSPAVCVAKVVNDDITFENCTFHFLKQTKSQKSFDKIYSYDYPEYTDDIERFSALSSWVLERIRWFNGRVQRVFLEDYAFGATGRVFHIAENTGILKKTLRSSGFIYDTLPPTVVKKYATGKGNANKDLMYETFVSETKIDLQEKLSSLKFRHSVVVTDGVFSMDGDTAPLKEISEICSKFGAWLIR